MFLTKRYGPGHGSLTGLLEDCSRGYLFPQLPHGSLYLTLPILLNKHPNPHFGGLTFGDYFGGSAD